MVKRMPFQELIDLVKAHGGSMRYERGGIEFVEWVIALPGRRRVFRSYGSGIPELNRLYKPKRGHEPTGRDDDHSRVLVDNAWERLLDLMRRSD